MRKVNTIEMICCAVLLLAHAVEAQAIRVPGTPSNFRAPGEKGQLLDRALFLRIPKISTDYVLGPGDELKIEVVGEDALTVALQTVKISNSGEISVPFLGSLQAAGKTAAELEASIAGLLERRELMKRAEVLVFISDYQAKPIYIMGEVDNPGEYIMSQQMTLMEAIFMAGGIDFTADRFGYLHRRVSSKGSQRPEGILSHPDKAGPGAEAIKVDLEPLKNGGVLQPDIALRAEDVFVVPKRPVRLFYAIGDFRLPGAYEIPPPAERGLRVSQALAQAGGPNQTAKLSRGVLVRYDEDGKRVDRKINISAILQGKEPDIPIQPNDIMFIPGSTVKTLEYGLLGSLPGAVQSSAQTTIQTVRSR